MDMISNLKHAKAIVKKLTSRPHLKDDDDYYDMVADENQCIDIVKEYLDKKFKQD
jgi:hypothetical protein